VIVPVVASTSTVAGFSSWPMSTLEPVNTRILDIGWKGMGTKGRTTYLAGIEEAPRKRDKRVIDASQPLQTGSRLTHSHIHETKILPLTFGNAMLL